MGLDSKFFEFCPSDHLTGVIFNAFEERKLMYVLEN